MKKAILLLLWIFIFSSSFVYTQDKPERTATYKPTNWQRELWRMTPDGYVGGVTFIIEPGFDFANGEYEEDTEGFYLPGIPQYISQDISIRNPFIKFAILVPLRYNSTFFIKALTSWFKEKGERNDYFFYNELSYTRISISAGLKFYIK